MTSLWSCISQYLLLLTLKADVNRDLTNGVLKIRTKKETIKGKGDCKGTLDRLLALFFSYFQSTCVGSVWGCDKGRIGRYRSSTNNQAGPSESVRQQSNATPLLRIQGENWQCYHTHPIQVKSLESYSSLPSFKHSNCKTEYQSQFFVP